MSDFTVDWFDFNQGHLVSALARYQGRPHVRMLEIGAYEGRSTVWFLDAVLTGEGCHLTSVDTWEGSAENDPSEMDEVWERFQRNTARYVDEGRLSVVVGQSQPFLASRIASGHTSPGNGFHIIYVDGSHAAPDVLSDAVLSWAVLEPGGIMIFDDYIWAGMTTEQERPRFAIDSFLACFLGQYDEIHRGNQIIIRRHGANAALGAESESAAEAANGQLPGQPIPAAQVTAAQRRGRGKRSRR
ncbi:MAG: class I SAM-dependent methyltransferase [Thermomicrobiales bacterium]